MDRHDAEFTVDPRPRRRRRRQYDAPTDGWTAHASPLEHWQMVTVGCRYSGGTVTDIPACVEASWAQHLTICTNCRRQEIIAQILENVARMRAAREAAA
jgi:hypothetical protein